ncbi:[methyl-Co(III) methanol-specific corrinoid protein]:coenzyme M methyltransferase [Desulfacinum infernum DSM 9756]|uniref:[methyl-Co(III) methanol-specific corrinoid protein]:coenzyme M methyltransferase n=1 Tax=Desulfacinum infernum DSM 9756 TaxID=1121391 RepID=A0A1M5BR98_9BACT|nr:MtaA/CmuA family methyltransferase [Desulfacinum infernum]SHF44787.1 [methyl-Co(III) methanol-specific corrinoid protein]:coenzyme M methyltransferase [Desulfacinum infernum DSM 9756]
MKESSYSLFMSALFNGRKGSRPPVANPTSIVCHELMDRVGVGFPEAHLNAQAMAELALAGHEVVGFDAVMPEFSVHQEAAALGCQVDWGNRNAMPDAKNFPYEDFSPIHIPENLLERPSMRVVLDAISILRRHVGGRAAIIGKVMGPWTLAYHMAGTQNFLLQIGLGEDEVVHRMLRQLMPVPIRFANAMFQAGADAVVLADHATGNLVSPAQYEKFLLPLHRELTSQIHGPVILHVCGNCSDRLELFAASGVDAYHMEWQVDAKDAVARVGHLISLIGNINNPQTLYQGTPEDVYKQARYAIASGVHIIAPECAVPLATPLENLKAIVAAAHEGY